MEHIAGVGGLRDSSLNTSRCDRQNQDPQDTDKRLGMHRSKLTDNDCAKCYVALSFERPEYRADWCVQSFSWIAQAARLLPLAQDTTQDKTTVFNNSAPLVSLSSTVTGERRTTANEI